jgi:hypothetical protein
MRTAPVKRLERALLRLLMALTVAVVERRIRSALSRRDGGLQGEGGLGHRA